MQSPTVLAWIKLPLLYLHWVAIIFRRKTICSFPVYLQNRHETYFTDVVSHLWKFLLCGFYLSLTVYGSTCWFQLKSAVLHWKVYTWAATLCGVGSTRKQEEEAFDKVPHKEKINFQTYFVWLQQYFY